MTSPTVEPVIVPLHHDESGSLRIGQTRVLLELISGPFATGPLLRNWYGPMIHCDCLTSTLSSHSLNRCIHLARAAPLQIFAAKSPKGKTELLLHRRSARYSAGQLARTEILSVWSGAYRV